MVDRNDDRIEALAGNIEKLVFDLLAIVRNECGESAFAGVAEDLILRLVSVLAAETGTADAARVLAEIGAVLTIEPTLPRTPRAAVPLTV